MRNVVSTAEGSSGVDAQPFGIRWKNASRARGASAAMHISRPAADSAAAAALRGKSAASYARERGLDVGAVLDQREGELGGVEHRQVRALAGEGRHEMRRVPEERHPRDARPGVIDGERVDAARDDGVVAVLDETPKRGAPALEMLEQRGAGGRRVGPVDAAR